MHVSLPTQLLLYQIEHLLLRYAAVSRLVCGMGVALSSLVSGGAYGADLLTKAPPVPYAQADDFWTRPYLLGDLGRTRLKEMGIDLSLQLGDEAVTNGQ